MHPDKPTTLIDGQGDVAKEAAPDVRELVIAAMERAAIGVDALLFAGISRVVEKVAVDSNLGGPQMEYLASILAAFAQLGVLLGGQACAADPAAAVEMSPDERWSYLRRFMDGLAALGITF